jgi:hypothetical protein
MKIFIRNLYFVELFLNMNVLQLQTCSNHKVQWEARYEPSDANRTVRTVPKHQDQISPFLWVDHENSNK